MYVFVDVYLAVRYGRHPFCEDFRTAAVRMKHCRACTLRSRLDPYRRPVRVGDYCCGVVHVVRLLHALGTRRGARRAALSSEPRAGPERAITAAGGNYATFPIYYSCILVVRSTGRLGAGLL